MVFANAAFVFTEANIQHPMQTILHAPMTAYRFAKQIRLGCEAADVVASTGFFFFALLTSRTHGHANTFQLRPLVQYRKILRDLHSIVSSFLFTTMAFEVGGMNCVR